MGRSLKKAGSYVPSPKKVPGQLPDPEQSDLRGMRIFLTVCVKNIDKSAKKYTIVESFAQLADVSFEMRFFYVNIDCWNQLG